LIPFYYCQTSIGNLPCVDIPGGPLCIEITNKDCLELTGTVTLGGIPYRETSILISDILTQIQNRDPNTGNLMCFNLVQLNEMACSLCATVDSLNITGNSIHYCGSGKFNCSISNTPTISQPFDISCVDLTNCDLLKCRNQCNKKGHCTSFGMCNCDPEYYGYDCSLHISESRNCASSTLLGDTCWQVEPTCDSVEVLIISDGKTSTKTYKYNEFTSFPIVPSKTVINEPSINCDITLNMENIHTAQDNLIGCPTLNLTCNSILARSDRLNCINLAKYDPCPDNPTPDEPQQSSNYSSQIFFGLGLMLVILVLLSLGYLVIKKFGGFGKSNPEVYVEDEEPLNDSDY
jgi:hypothetical protein